MYEPFYGLKFKPFSLAPDPRFIFWASPHSIAAAMLEYGILNHAGITVITGEIGSGKTTLIRHLLGKLEQDINVGMLSNMQSGRGELLEWVLMAFDQDYEIGSHVGRHKALETYLKEQHRKGKRTVLIVDEAQNLDISSLEELRLISNFNDFGEELLQIVLSGQPELKDLLGEPRLTQFAQRVSSDFHLGLLRREDVRGYVEHRLSVAGAKNQLFSEDAYDVIYDATRGTPRLINILCDTALIYGYATESETISKKMVEKVVSDKKTFGIFPERLGKSTAEVD